MCCYAMLIGFSFYPGDQAQIVQRHVNLTVILNQISFCCSEVCTDSQEEHLGLQQRQLQRRKLSGDAAEREWNPSADARYCRITRGLKKFSSELPRI